MSREDAFANLRNSLASLYPDEDDARLVAADAGLDERRIAFSDRAIHSWNSILREAENTSKTEALFRVILAEYGSHPTLQITIDTYRQWASSEPPKPIPPDPSPLPRKDGKTIPNPSIMPAPESGPHIPTWFPAAGMTFGALTLLFFMGVVIASLYQYEVPCDTRFSVAVVLALGAALAASFLGGSAAAKGQLPFPFSEVNPLQFSVGGGVAVLIIVLLLSNRIYANATCTDQNTPLATMETPDSNSMTQTLPIDGIGHPSQNSTPNVVPKLSIVPTETVTTVISFDRSALTDSHSTEIPLPVEPVSGALWTNPIDGAAYIYVPNGDVTIGSELDEIQEAFELCDQARQGTANQSDCQSWFQNEWPPTRVSLDEGIWIKQTEVTNAQYAQCVQKGRCDRPESTAFLNPSYADYPVEVAWLNALAYAKWAGGAEGRLPTEVEWENACRGSSRYVYPWGDDWQTARLDHINYCDQNCQNEWRDSDVDDDYPTTGPVGSFMKGRSPYGLLDMSGNVWEWTSSKDFEYPYQENDGRENVLSSAGNRIVRGGSWAADGSNVRCAARWGVSIDEPMGLRIVIPDGKPIVIQSDKP